MADATAAPEPCGINVPCLGPYGTRDDLVLLIFMTLFQAVLWAFLYHKYGPIRSRLSDWISADEGKREMLRLNDYEEGNWAFWIVITIHHGGGGFIALAAMFISDEWWQVLILRIGVSMEIGEDILHYFQMIHATIVPKGNEMFGEFYPDCKMWFAIGCHHAVGAIAGSWIFVYVPWNRDAQFCIVLLLLSAVPGLLEYPFVPFVNLKAEVVSTGGRIVSFLMLAGGLAALYGRIAIFPPKAWALCQWVATPETDVPPGGGFSQTTANVLLVSAGLFMLFVFAGLVVAFPDLVAMAKAIFGYGPQGSTSELGEKPPSALTSAMNAVTAASASDNRRRSTRNAGDIALVAVEDGGGKAPLKPAADA